MSSVRIRAKCVFGALMVLTSAFATARGEAPGDLRPPGVRAREAMEQLKGLRVFEDTDPWARAICTMIDAGRDGAVPELLEGLRDTDLPRLQRTIPLALGEIGDRRAIPWLIYALARCRVDTGNNGFSIPDGELFWRIRRAFGDPVEDDFGGVSDDRPEQAMVGALEKLTGHREPMWNQSQYGGDGQWPSGGGEAQHERGHQVQRRMANRWWRWWDENKKTLLKADELAWVEQRAPKSYQEANFNRSKSVKLVVRDASGAAVPDCAIEVWADRNRYAHKTHADGRITIPLAGNAQRVSVLAEEPGLVPAMILWGAEVPIPTDEAELKLEQARESAGRVLGADGNPLAGATVWLVAPKSVSKNVWSDVAFREAKTDENGRWRTVQLLPGAHKIKLFISAPHHQPFDISLDSDTLKDGRYTAALKPSFDVIGVVRDEAGKPVPNARVRAVGEPAWKHNYLPVTTDADGKFVLPEVVPTKLKLIAQAEGHAPAWVEADVQFDKCVAPLEVTLKKGRNVAGQVTDAGGKPVAGAIVNFATWHGTRLADWFTRTDSDGRFAWANAPTDAALFEVFKSGAITGWVELPAGDTAAPVAVTLKPAFRVTGTVTDARNGKPVERGGYVVGVASNSGGRFLWRNVGGDFSGGKYEKLFATSHVRPGRDRRGGGDTQRHYLRIEADGHVPQETRFFDRDEGPLTFDVKLEPGTPIAGTVLTPDDKPAIGAEVLVATPTQLAEVRDGRRQTDDPERVCFALTDEQGRFTHRPQNEAYELVILHDSGALRITQARLEALGGKPIELQPWGAVEGSVMKNGKPVSGAQMTLSEGTSGDDDDRAPGEGRVQIFQTMNTGKDGRFEAQRLLPGRYRLSAEHTQEGAMGFSGPGVPFAAAAGQTVRFNFGEPATRPVVGRLVLKRQESDVDWTKAKLTLSARPQERRRAGKNEQPATAPKLPDPVIVPVKADGTFRIDSVNQSPTDAWQLLLDEATLPPRPNDPTARGRKMSGGVNSELPASPGEQASSPIDLGDVRVQTSLAPLVVGMVAPPIEATTLDGKPFKLSDYRGKYVLLDFWATWCGPCIGETPHLKKVHEAFAKDDRFVMIGLSMDTGPDDALGYTRQNGMNWVQGFIGFWGKHPAASDYGVNGIPAILLIGPDGKVIATELRGEKILEKVSEALNAAKS